MNKFFLKLRDGFALAKFQFDIGNNFLVFVNFSLLVIAASGQIQKVWPISTVAIWSIIIPVSFFGAWLFGWFMDKIVKYQTAYYKHSNDRVPQFAEIKDMISALDKKIDKMEKMIQDGSKGN